MVFIGWMQTPKFYTYLLIDPRTDTPFYIGKGTGERMYWHDENHANSFTRARIIEIKTAGLKLIYEKWFESDDEDFCYWMENYLIDYFGRENLCNITRGGQAGPPSGEEHPSKDPKVRAKMSASRKSREDCIVLASKAGKSSAEKRRQEGTFFESQKERSNKGVEANRATGFSNLKKAVEVHRAKGFKMPDGVHDLGCAARRAACAKRYEECFESLKPVFANGIGFDKLQELILQFGGIGAKKFVRDLVATGKCWKAPGKRGRYFLKNKTS